MSDLKNVIPPIKVYAGLGNPYKSSYKSFTDNVNQQAELNNKHGGRPSELIIPQAPTSGMLPQGPTNGNSLIAAASKTLLDSHVNSQYDSEVKVPPIPRQSGLQGGSLMQRLEMLFKKTQKANKNKKTKKTHKAKKIQKANKSKKTNKHRKANNKRRQRSSNKKK